MGRSTHSKPGRTMHRSEDTLKKSLDWMDPMLAHNWNAFALYSLVVVSMIASVGMILQTVRSITSDNG